MPSTNAQASKIEAKAKAASSKSEGMRMLYDAGYTVAQVRTILGVPYGFAYGVAQRHNVVDTAANRRTPAKAKAKAQAPARKADKVSATARVAAKLIKGKATPVAKAKPGRPSAVRRAANRAPRTTKVAAK